MEPMATQTRISVEDYLHCFEWEPDAEYVDGEVEERPVGAKSHAKWQEAILYWFRLHEKEWRVFGYPELRVQVLAANFLIPDVLLLDENAPDEEIVTESPVAVFEVWSPENRLDPMMRKFSMYAAMGIREVWLVYPETSAWMRWEAGQLVRRDEFALPERGIRFAMAEIGKLVR